MKKLSKTEVSKLSIRVTAAKSNEIINEINKLQVGEGLFIDQKEWTRTTPIAVAVHNWRKRYIKCKISTTNTPEGTYIIRIS